MIKVETIGMIQNSVNDPTIISDKDVKNYSFLTVDDDVYLISNTLTGDGAYSVDATIKAGECLNGFLVKAWEGQNLIVDGKHIEGGIGELSAEDTLIIDEETGGLKEGSADGGVYFIVADTKVALTEAAIKVRVAVAAKTEA